MGINRECRFGGVDVTSDLIVIEGGLEGESVSGRVVLCIRGN